MVIKPNIVRLLYGTIVVATVATTGTLWYNRTGAKVIKTVDFIELYQASIERVMAAEYCTDRTNYPVPAVYTNYNAVWTPDSRTWTYHVGANVITTNYWVLSGYTNPVVVTNTEINRKFRLCIQFTDFSWMSTFPASGRGLLGSQDRQRYIWNGYSNLTVSGAGSLDGTYSAQATGAVPTAYPQITGAPQIYFWQSGTNWLIDRGPSLNCMLGSEFALTTPEYFDWDILDYINPITNTLYTRTADSALNGPWFAYGDSPAGTTVSGSGFAPNLLREAICHWYLDKTTGTGIDSRYDTHGARLIDAHVTRAELVDLFSPYSPYNDRFISYRWGESYGVSTPHPLYISTNVTPGVISNYAQFADYAVTGNLSVLSNIANPPQTSNLTAIAQYLTSLCWTRADGTYRWMNPGTKSNTVVTNYWYGYGWATSWAAAKAIAETNFGPVSATIDNGGWPISGPSYTFTSGSHIGAGYVAEIASLSDDVTYLGACTDIVSDVAFWVIGEMPGSVDLNPVYDNFGTGILTNYYTEVAVQTNSVNRFPCVTVGSTNYAWCSEPMTYPDNEQLRGWVAKDPEIIQKWHFNYLTNAIP